MGEKYSHAKTRSRLLFSMCYFLKLMKTMGSQVRGKLQAVANGHTLFSREELAGDFSLAFLASQIYVFWSL